MFRSRWQSWALCASACVLAMLTGCASVTQGTTQTVRIDTLTASGQIVDGAECKLINDKTDMVILSGQSGVVRRSGATLDIECNQAGQLPASGQATSRVNTGMVGNILLGGVIGAAIDSSTGAGFNYPSWMQLVFGEVRTFDRSSQTNEQVVVGLRVGETRMAAAAPATPATPLTRPPEAPAAAAATPMAAPVPVAPQLTAVAQAAPQLAPTPSAPALSPPPPPAPSNARVSMDDLKGLLGTKP